MNTEADNLAAWRALEIPMARHLGIDIAGMVDGRAELRYAPLPEHLNSFGVNHGGAVMTLLDITLAAAARSVQMDLGVVTVEMKTSFMQPARGPMVARSRLMHRTRSMAFVEGTVEDGDGRICAHATGTFKYVPRPAGAGGQAPLPTD